MIFRKNIESPLGNLVACATSQGVCLLQFSDNLKLESQLKQISQALQTEIIEGENNILKTLETELSEYFSGNRKEFSTTIHFIGTDFQKGVWQILQNIPYGKTISYQQEAHLLQNPKAVRAVANANAQNKICILIPCHRVIGANGSLTGYAGGLWRKEKLLQLENIR